MGILSKFFGPDNSIILASDVRTDQDFEIFRERIEEVRKFYSIKLFSESVQEWKRGKTRGLATIVLRHARRATLRTIVPWLLEQDLPFSITLRIDCIGVNRLTPEDELKTVSGFLSTDVVERLHQLNFEDSSRFWEELSVHREKKGEKIIPSLEPGLFMVTWGELVELPTSRVELGAHITTSKTENLVGELTFMVQRIGREPVFLFDSSCRPPGALSSLKLPIIVDREGVVDRHVDLGNLLIWPLAK